MGVYSTTTVSREYAIKELSEKLMTFSNDELGKMLDAAIGEEMLSNFVVVDDGQYLIGNIYENPELREGVKEL